MACNYIDPDELKEEPPRIMSRQEFIEGLTSLEVSRGGPGSLAWDRLADHDALFRRYVGEGSGSIIGEIATLRAQLATLTTERDRYRALVLRVAQMDDRFRNFTWFKEIDALIDACREAAREDGSK